MSDIEFRFVQPNEFDDWYYEYYSNGKHLYNVIYYEREWCFAMLTDGIFLNDYGLEVCLAKIQALNTTTKPKNWLGF